MTTDELVRRFPTIPPHLRGEAALAAFAETFGDLLATVEKPSACTTDHTPAHRCYLKLMGPIDIHTYGLYSRERVVAELEGLVADFEKDPEGFVAAILQAPETARSSELCWMTATELARHYRSGDLSPVEVTEAYLERIAEVDVAGELPTGSAYITVTTDRARADAAAAEQVLRSGDPGPLTGVPLALKDLFETAGVLTTSGSRSRATLVPDRSCTVARRLAAAGTVLLGKTNMVEFAFGPYGFNAHYGIPPNPWDPSCVPGGSSSGSGAAVAGGMACVALGTDTGGSVRIPSAFCGIVGLKTTVGRVSREGVTPLSWTLDSVGPMTRSVEDAALVYEAIAGPDPDDPTTLAAPADNDASDRRLDVAGMRVGIVRDPFFKDADAAVVTAVEAAADVLAKAGVTFVEMEMPEAVRGVKDVGALTFMRVEGYASHGETFRREPENCDPSVVERLGMGASVTAPDYAGWLQRHKADKHAAAESMRDLDALLAPTLPSGAPRRDALVEEQPRQLSTRAVNWLGLCALTLPCGFTGNGLPVGLQLIGKAFGEGAVLRLGARYENETNWHTQRPGAAD